MNNHNSHLLPSTGRTGVPRGEFNDNNNTFDNAGGGEFMSPWQSQQSQHQQAQQGNSSAGGFSGDGAVFGDAGNVAGNYAGDSNNFGGMYNYHNDQETNPRWSSEHGASNSYDNGRRGPSSSWSNFPQAEVGGANNSESNWAPAAVNNEMNSSFNNTTVQEPWPSSSYNNTNQMDGLNYNAHQQQQQPEHSNTNQMDGLDYNAHRQQQQQQQQQQLDHGIAHSWNQQQAPVMDFNNNMNDIFQQGQEQRQSQASEVHIAQRAGNDRYFENSGAGSFNRNLEEHQYQSVGALDSASNKFGESNFLGAEYSSTSKMDSRNSNDMNDDPFGNQQSHQEGRSHSEPNSANDLVYSTTGMVRSPDVGTDVNTRVDGDTSKAEPVARGLAPMRSVGPADSGTGAGGPITEVNADHDSINDERQQQSQLGAGIRPEQGNEAGQEPHALARDRGSGANDLEKRQALQQCPTDTSQLQPEETSKLAARTSSRDGPSTKATLAAKASDTDAVSTIVDDAVGNQNHHLPVARANRPVGDDSSKVKKSTGGDKSVIYTTLQEIDDIIDNIDPNGEAQAESKSAEDEVERGGDIVKDTGAQKEVSSSDHQDPKKRSGKTSANLENVEKKQSVDKMAGQESLSGVHNVVNAERKQNAEKPNALSGDLHRPTESTQNAPAVNHLDGAGTDVDGTQNETENSEPVDSLANASARPRKKMRAGKTTFQGQSSPKLDPTSADEPVIDLTSSPDKNNSGKNRQELGKTKAKPTSNERHRTVARKTTGVPSSTSVSPNKGNQKKRSRLTNGDDGGTQDGRPDEQEESVSKSTGSPNQKRQRTDDVESARAETVDDNSTTASDEDQVIPLHADALEVGTRVYCRWRENEMWYWGKVTRKYKIKKEAKKFVYRVDFDDGTHDWNLKSTDMITEDMYKKFPPPTLPGAAVGTVSSSAPPAQSSPKGKKQRQQQKQPQQKQPQQQLPQDSGIPVDKAPGDSIRPSTSSVCATDPQQSARSLMEKWWNLRCGQCRNCKRMRCRKCVLCSEKLTPKTIQTRAFCFRRACCNLAPDVTAQPAPGFPAGWKFTFGPETSQSPGLESYHGIIVLSPTGRRYRTAERAVGHNAVSLKHVDVDDFYKYVGMSDRGSEKPWYEADGMETSPAGQPKAKADNGKKSPRSGPSLGSDASSGPADNGKGALLQPPLPSPSKANSRTSPKGARAEGYAAVAVRKADSLARQDSVISAPSTGRSSGAPRSVGRPKKIETKGSISSSTGFKKRELSNKLVVGARCYSLFTNGMWYWGTIANIVQSGKFPTCSVVFDDGDVLDNVPFRDMYTEVEYKNSFNKDPPDPPHPPVNDGDASEEVVSSEVVADTKQRPTLMRRDSSMSCSDVSMGASDEKIDESERLSLIDLRLNRCKDCSLCRKDDCQRCEACVNNRGSTTVCKQVCLLKMCLKFSDSQKAQPVQGLPRGWFFYFTDPSVCPTTFKGAAPHPSLEGLRIVSPKGSRKFRGVDKAAGVCRLPEEQAAAVAHAFYVHQLGIPLRIKRDHVLVGKPILRQWIENKYGRVKEVFGMVTKCEEDYFSKGTLRFTVEYDESSRSLVQSIDKSGTCVPKIDKDVSEVMCWAACLLHDKKVMQSNHCPRFLAKVPRPFHLHWIVPNMRTTEMVKLDGLETSTPQVTLTVRGFKIVLLAKTSGIPNAGLGVFATCTPLSPWVGSANQSHFELHAGELIDLGLYAPIRIQDRKPDHISLLKNFIHNWKCESWSFDMAAHERGKEAGVLDITDDTTGDLHAEARKNVLSYVNETDGKETPTIRAEHDPEGSVHYLMGHADRRQGVFRLPLNEEKELKIDYGPAYEKVRVRKGYSRLTLHQQEPLKKSIMEDDVEMIREIKLYTAREIEESVAFLRENIVRVKEDWSREEALRALIAVVLFKARLRDILAEFKNVDVDSDDVSVCDNGFSQLGKNKTVKRTGELVSKMCKTHFWPNASDPEPHELLLKDELHRVVLAEILKCSTQDLMNMRGKDLRGKLLAI